MRYFQVVFAIILIVICISCDSGDDLACIRVSSEIISENREVEGFTGVVLNHPGDLMLTQDDEFSVRLSGPENVVELIETSLEGSKLVIGTNECFNGEYDLKVEIAAPEFNSIQFFGRGEVKTQNPIEGDLVQLEVQGETTIDMDFNVDSLHTEIWGANTIKFSGVATQHQFISAGEFSLDANSLSTGSTSLIISGMGDSYVHVSDKLNVVLAGIGNVYYKGNPAIESEITGTGEIIDNN